MNVLVRAAAFATLVILPTRSPAAAQSTPAPATQSGEIRGRVVAAARQLPINQATVIASTLGTTTAAGRATAGADGTFLINGLKPGRYRVRILAIGYAAKELPAAISTALPRVDLGTVPLTAIAVELQQLEVRGQRQDVQLAPDRSTYVVRDMPTTRGGTALDVLRNVPSVDVDIDNLVSLRGNTGVIVQINGRPSPMKPAQLGNFLAQMPAGIVDKIEVVPNPSAKEDPTGTAGIINIVLKQDADAGTSGGLTVAGGTTGQVNLGANVGYQKGPLTLYGSYGFLRDKRPRSDSIFRQNLYADPVTFLDEFGARNQLPLAHTLTGSLNYDLSEHDELALDGLFSTRDQRDTYALIYRTLNSQRTLTGLADRTIDSQGNESSLEGTLGYRHSFAKGHRLSSELTFSRDQEGGPGSVVARTLALDGTPVGASALENQIAWERPRDGSFKVDYTKPLGKRWRLEAGYKGNLLRIHTTLDTQIFDPMAAAYRPDSARIRDFTWRQFVNAGYFVLNAQLGKYTLQGGVRIERATTRFHLNTIGQTYENPYNSVFPSGLVSWNVDDAHQVKLSYSTRVRRPDDTDVLDPTPHYQDPLNLQVGNPQLKPEYIRAFELGLQRTHGRTTMQLSPYYRHTHDAVRTIRSIDPSTGVTTRTFANVATVDAFGADATVALTGRGKLSGFVGASAYRQISDAANIGPGLNAKTFGWSARTNLSYRFSSTLDMQVFASYRAAATVEQGRNASQTRITLAARKKLMSDRLSVTLRVIDPFNTSVESNTTIDPLFTQMSDRRRKIRGLLLNLNWMFGKPEQEPALIDLAVP